MIIKLFGIFDVVIASLFFVFNIFNLSYLNGIVLLLGFFLLVKGIIFAIKLDITSILDIASSIIIISSSSINIHIVIVILTSLFLFQKGVFSLLN